MHAFSLRYRSSWITRAFGRNPLLRWTDRTEACVIVFAILVALAATPVCAPLALASTDRTPGSTRSSPGHVTLSPRRWSKRARARTRRTQPALPS